MLGESKEPLIFDSMLDIPDKSLRIAVYGAGGFCRHLLKRLATERKDCQVPFIVDTFKFGKKFGFDIIAPESLTGTQKNRYDLVLITTEPESRPAILKTLRRIGVNKIAVGSETLRRECSQKNSADGSIDFVFNGESKLNLGGGAHWYREGWLNLDFGQNGYDLAVNLLSPLKDGSIDIIYSSHFLEHILPEECYRLIKDCHRVLKVGGMMRIALPDCEKTLKRFFAEEPIATFAYDHEEYLNVIRHAGGNPEGLHLKSNMGHFFFWDRYTFSWLLIMAGFTDIHERTCCQSSNPELQSPVVVNNLGHPIDGFDVVEFDEGTFYVEIYKT